MQIRSTTRRLFTWLAFLALLLNAFAPAAAQVLAASRPQIPVDVCSVHGGAPLAAAVAVLNLDDDKSHARAGCGDCLSHCAAHGMPPTAGLSLPVLPAGPVRPYLFYHAPRPLLALSAAPPRGPPSLA